MHSAESRNSIRVSVNRGAHAICYSRFHLILIFSPYVDKHTLHTSLCIQYNVLIRCMRDEKYNNVVYLLYFPRYSYAANALKTYFYTRITMSQICRIIKIKETLLSNVYMFKVHVIFKVNHQLVCLLVSTNFYLKKE